MKLSYYSRAFIISNLSQTSPMKPTKPSAFDLPLEEEPDISDIAEIFQKLNNCSRPQSIKPYSEYDPQSIFPPPSQISANQNENESDKSRSNNFGNVWKRSGLSEAKDEISFGSKYELNVKKVKKIQVQKVVTTPQLTFGHHKEEEVSNKDSLPNARQSIHLNSPSTNFKITDYFALKKIAPKLRTYEIEEFQIRQELKPDSLPQKLQKIDSHPVVQQQKPNPLINSLVEKNAKRNRHIKELKEELEALKARKQSSQMLLYESKQEQKRKLKLKLTETYQRKIQFQKFKAQMLVYLNQQRIQSSILPQIEAKIRNLDEHKKKSNQKKGANKKQIHTDEESIGNTYQQINYNQNPHQIPDRKSYLNQWMSKLQKFKEKVETDQKYYEKLYQVHKNSQQISEDISKAFQKNNFPKDYVLFCIEHPYAESKTSAQEIGEIQAFNTEHLRAEVLTLLKYPKLSTQGAKKQIEKELNSLFKLSKKLHNSASFYFLQTTMASQMGQSSELIVYGREKNEDFENLTEALNKYEPFSQVMVRYISRICLIALEEIKVKVDIPVFFLPLNIYFTPKCDIKFSNILMNSLFLQEEFKPYLKENRLYYFIAPEALSQKDYSGLSVWSLGVLLYYIIYEKYPFEYEFYDSFQKETFFIYNELNFPSKPVVNEKLKEFISICLGGKERDLFQLQRHQFFHK